MKFISLFAGIGGFDLALERLGHECVYANDIDTYCKIVYDKHFNTKQTTQDIRTIASGDIPDHDILCGGFPCQSFSVAGKRGGFNDTRGTLFYEIARIAQDKRPTYLFLENVKGLLSHDNGRTFETILRTFDELGYELQWQVLNSKNFGVPQNRERVFIIGHLRKTSRPQIFPLRENTSTSQIKIIGTTKGDENTRQGHRDLVYADSGIVGALKATDYKQPLQIIQLNNPTHSNNRIYSTEGIAPTLNTMQGGDRQPKIVQRYPLKFLQRNQKNIQGDYAFTVDTSNTGGVKVNHKIRKLTPLECERLQGFPDGWTEGVSDTQRYKMLGNAVTVNVIYEIAKYL